MIYSIDCTARVNAQDPDNPTFKKIDCTAHCNANVNWYGKIIVCTATITSIIVAACKSWDQGIRLKVVIDDVDVSEAIIGSLSIQHDKNKISTFTLNLGDTQYSPRTNGHIDLDKPIVITVYINRQEQKLFTGSIDEPEAENTPAFRVIVPGRDYGKKLLDKKMTLISVQDLAVSTKRSDVIKYIAEQAGISSVDIPEMDPITIDNSFQDQSLWDMIQKEAMVEQYWVKSDEDGNLKLLIDEIKSDPVLYPTPDWSYDEDRFIRLGYKKPRTGINKIIVLGKTNIERRETIGEEGELLNYHKTWEASNDQNDIEGTETIGKFTIKIECHAWSTPPTRARYSIHIYWTENDYEIKDYYVQGDNINIYGKGIWRNIGKMYASFFRYGDGVNFDAGAINIYLQGSQISYENLYDRISAIVTDPNSIEKYGERDGGSVEYPMLETGEQCVAAGKKIIRNNHKLGIASFEIPFNPLLKTGQTMALSDRKIGLTERYLVEGVGHGIEIDGEGKIKARTQVRGICYA
ncbi:hypothetical protein ES705_32274 [subsurface metagenome]